MGRSEVDGQHNKSGTQQRRPCGRSGSNQHWGVASTWSHPSRLPGRRSAVGPAAHRAQVLAVGLLELVPHQVDQGLQQAGSRRSGQQVDGTREWSPSLLARRRARRAKGKEGGCPHRVLLIEVSSHQVFDAVPDGGTLALDLLPPHRRRRCGERRPLRRLLRLLAGTTCHGHPQLPSPLVVC